MRGSKYKIKLSNTERKDLEKIVRSHNAPQKLVRRAKIILLADDGLNYYVIAQVLSIQDKIVTTWVKRWLKTTDKELSIIDRLLDLPRPGAPDKFTPEQICQIITIACEKPEIYGRPITNWTNRELADEVKVPLSNLKNGFKHVYGDSVYNFLISYKMEYARRMLLTKEHSVEEIALKVGYSTSSHFIAAFKKKYNITPKKYMGNKN